MIRQSARGRTTRGQIEEKTGLQIPTPVFSITSPTHVEARNGAAAATAQKNPQPTVTTPVGDGFLQMCPVLRDQTHSTNGQGQDQVPQQSFDPTQSSATCPENKNFFTLDNPGSQPACCESGRHTC